MINDRIEVLAPVGSMESLEAALQAGTDSIYFGVEQLNMRAKAADLSIDNIPEIVERCKKQGVKKYLTLNSTVYDHDKKLYRDIITKCKEHGVDAIIATDIAVIGECNRQGMSVHISTQANVTNLDAVKFYSFYADLIVLSRELTMKQIAEITRGIKANDIRGPKGELLKIEVFAHGALCMAISGKCYLSLHANNSSANRGACVQNCRHAFTVNDKENGQELVVQNEYIMSSKDLCTIDILDQVAETGVSVIKIEGRGRSADYVYATVKCYKEAIASIQNGAYTKEKIDGWKTELSSVYNRGFWEGYYLGRKFGVWADVGGSKATKRKIYLAKGVRYYPNIRVAEFKLESGSLKVGDEIMLIGNQTGVVHQKVQTIHVNNTSVNSVEKGRNFSIPFNKQIRPADKLYKLIPTEYAQDYVLQE